MNSLNSLIVEGRLVKDAVLKELPSGLKIGEMTVAVNRNYKGSNGEWTEEVSFFDISSFGKMAEVSVEKGKKGFEIRVVGRLKQERWESNGKQNSKVVIVAEHIDYKESEKKKLVEESVQEDVEIPIEAGFNIGF